MKLILPLAATIALGATGVAASPLPSLTHRHPAAHAIPGRSAAPLDLGRSLDMLLPGGKAGWYPGLIVTQSLDHSTGVWSTVSSTSITYDEQHRATAITTALPPATGSAAYTIRLGYESEKSELPDTVTVGAFDNALEQMHITYDPIVTSYPVKIEERSSRPDGSWSAWRVTLDVEVTRDERGRVTAVKPRVLDADDLPLEYEWLEISYGTGDYPVAVKSFVASDDGDSGVALDDAVELTGMKFEACDNQILMLTDLYTRSNRMTACHMTDDDGCELDMTVTYGERGSFTATSTGTDSDGAPVEEVMEMDYTDSYGSYTRLITTRHPATGYMEEEMEMAAYDEFGLLTESRSEERSTDPADSPVETDLWVKGSVDYTAAGLPQCYTRSAQVEGSDSFAPVMRQLFDGYDPTAGIAAPGADEAAPGAKGIYTIDGRPLPDGAVPASGFYIIDGVKTLVR